MRLLITGASGMLGQDVQRAAAGHEVLALARAELDITDATATQRTVRDVAPDVIINCAAWTNVDLAESAEADAFATNSAGAENMARAALAARALIIHISSDYVFDGRKGQPYVESDPPQPLSVYGRSKLAGEEGVARQAPGMHTIVRSAWLFGAGGPCFPATMMRLARERGELKVVDDQIGSPTFTGHLARALIELAQRPALGLVHVAGSGACSWFELAREVIARSGLAAEIAPTTTDQMPRPAPRPSYSALTTERPNEVPRLPDWREGVDEFLQAAVQSGPRRKSHRIRAVPGGAWRRPRSLAYLPGTPRELRPCQSPPVPSLGATGLTTETTS
jgi:dTDP-4-dehydrorhamnose reductase